MKELLEAGGAGFLIPAVLFAVMLYAARGLFGLYDHKNKIRREFLELWDSVRSQDDLWLEVAIRQLIGVYLPAHVIRLAFEQPDRCQALLELSELWPFLRYDRSSRTVNWASRRLRAIERSRMGRYIWTLSYFVFAFSALLMAASAYQIGHVDGIAWIFSIGALVFFVFAIVSVVRGETANVIVTHGEEWINRINSSASPARARTREGGKNSDDGLR